MPSPLKGRKKSAGVPRQVRKQLARDIHQAGGIQDFDCGRDQALKSTLDRNDRKQIYAAFKKNSNTRKTIQNLVNTWKGWKKEVYLEKVHIPFVLTPDGISEALDTDTDSDPDDRAEEDTNDAYSEHYQKQQSPKATRRTEATACETKRKQKDKETRRTSPTMDKFNALGDKLIVPLPKGLILCVIWVDSKLSNLDIVFGDDGYTVILKSKLPDPNGAGDLLSHCTWSNDPTNVVVSTVDDVLSKLKGKETDPTVKWIETEIVNTDEELLQAFVDIRGNPMKVENIGHKTDSDGRQIISFFLKTMKAHQAEQTAPRGNFARSNTGNPTGMDIGDNASVSSSSILGEETVEDIRAEFEDRVNELHRRAQERDEQLRLQMEQSNLQMTQMMNMFAQNQQQQQQQQQQLQQQQLQQQQQQQQQQTQLQPQPQPSGGGFVFNGAGQPDTVVSGGSHWLGVTPAVEDEIPKLIGLGKDLDEFMEKLERMN